MDRNKTWRVYMLIVVIILAFSFSIPLASVRAQTNPADTLCGDGSAPDYGLTYDLEQWHWTVGWEDYASQRAVDEVDVVLDDLNADSIAQTMILIKPQDEVGIRTNCAVHFLRYMRLGLPTGERKDNGFVFLIVVEKDSIDVHYAVGLGLPALTAHELTSINRIAEDAYNSTHSMDDALLTLVNEFDVVARNNYTPLAPVEEPGSTSVNFGQICLGILILLFLFWVIKQMNQGDGDGPSFDSFDGPSSFGGSSSSGGSSSWGRSSSSGGGGRSTPQTRGGSGSGRSGRTN